MIVRINKFRFSINFEIKNYVWLNRRHIKTIRLFDKLNNKKLNSYFVVKKKNIVYEFELFDNMHIHSIFHFWLLKKNLNDSLKKQHNDFSKFVIANETFEWKFDDILQFRYHYYRFQYRCKWSNWNRISKCSKYRRCFSRN